VKLVYLLNCVFIHLCFGLVSKIVQINQDCLINVASLFEPPYIITSQS